MSQARRGFTLVELLVVIAIIGVLAGMLLPAVNYARESARQTQCTNQQKQLALGVTQHLVNKKYFPGYVEQQRDIPVPMQPSIPAIDITWIQAIFPYIEQTAMAERWALVSASAGPTSDELKKVPLLICPSNREDWLGAFNSYCGNAGLASEGRLASGPSYAGEKAENGIFVYRGSGIDEKDMRKISDASVKDGLSTTLLLSENLQASNWNHTTDYLQLNDSNVNPATYGRKTGVTMTWFTNGSGVVASPTSTSWLPINGQKYDQPKNTAPRPSSEHPGVVVAAMGDGSVMRLSENIGYEVYAQLLGTNSTALRKSGTLTYMLNEADYKN